ncbi:MAG: serine/threonine-protein kinase [Ferruginibacter sp.]
MAKIFTITDGVENMGALKTGGQGSVYKGKRIGEIITAIKILPTPIYSESADDKNFVSFQNEVDKLKKVNQDANPNLVTILSSGITDTGNFPFIEMEYIGGPDLEELLKPPHDRIFTIQESLKVARHLSNALAHCHKVDVKHGDIKSNNVKYNSHTGNYILLDFGLSVMSDEQRRTSLRQAGAIEFMAPEQHEGQLLFETEVYSFGVILFELLSGVVPFPLEDSGETARNTVMIAQLEEAPPNLLSLRQQHLPQWWSKEKALHEMQVPEWMVSMIYKCLEKKPGGRFSNGMVLHEHIVRNSIAASGNTEWGAGRIVNLEQDNERLSKENKDLLQKLSGYKKPGNSVNSGSGRMKVAGLKNILILFLSLVISGFLIDRFLVDRKIEFQNNDVAAPADDMPAFSAAAGLQLKKAREFLYNGRVEEAKLIYQSLAVQEIPEAMYEFGNLTLLNGVDKTKCAEAMAYLARAAGNGYVPAKRTIGFLYSYSGDSLALQQNGYNGCRFNIDISRGSKLLMEASLRGDSIASGMLDDLNLKYGQ